MHVKIKHLQESPDPQQIASGLNSLENEIRGQAGKHIDKTFSEILLAEVRYLLEVYRE